MLCVCCRVCDSTRQLLCRVFLAVGHQRLDGRSQGRPPSGQVAKVQLRHCGVLFVPRGEAQASPRVRRSQDWCFPGTCSRRRGRVTLPFAGRGRSLARPRESGTVLETAVFAVSSILKLVYYLSVRDFSIALFLQQA